MGELEDKNTANGAAVGEIVTQPPKRSMTLADTGQTNFLDPNVYIQMKAMANDFVKSGAIPKGFTNAEQVLVGFQMGYEMGMKPMEALNSLYPVNGQLNIWGKATTRRLTEHGWQIAFTEESQESCTCTITKKSGGLISETRTYTETYKYADAEASGYTKDNYGKEKVGWKPGINRKLKLRYGVLSLIIKSYVPEVLGSAPDIVEVAEDFSVEDDGKAKSNKELMASAAQERAKLETGNFSPKVETPKEEPKGEQNV